MKLMIAFLVALFCHTVFAKELPIHRIWIKPDGYVVEGNYPNSLLGSTTTQTKLNMDAYDIKYRPHLMVLEIQDHPISQLKTILPSKRKRHRWRWSASQKKFYLDMTLPKNQDEKIQDLYSILSSTSSSKEDRIDAMLGIETIKSKNRKN